jgi:hypothetical protein
MVGDECIKTLRERPFGRQKHRQKENIEREV